MNEKQRELFNEFKAAQSLLKKVSDNCIDSARIIKENPCSLDAAIKHLTNVKSAIDAAELYDQFYERWMEA